MNYSASNPFKIGTRASPLALAQANETRQRLMDATALPEEAFEIVKISTTGDRILDRPLGAIGGKGLFTKEIEEALLSKDIDIAVHSMKDMPVDCPDGLAITCFLPREDVRDAFVSRKYASIDDLPIGATVGSSSLRRRAQLAATRPDLNLVEFRGNVQTRLRKLDDGVADATFLAMAGLNRLDMAHIAHPIAVDTILPAVAQGCIGIEQRSNDAEISAILRLINDDVATMQLLAERAFLGGLDGSCQTPIAGLATISGDELTLKGQVLRPDGSEEFSHSLTDKVDQARQMGVALAAILRSQMTVDFFH